MLSLIEFNFYRCFYNHFVYKLFLAYLGLFYGVDC